LVLLDLSHELTEAGAAVRLEEVHPEHFGQLAIRCENKPIEHTLAILIDYVSFSVNQVTSGVNQSTTPIDKVAISVLLKDRVSKRAHFKVAHHIIDVELRKLENFREITELEIFGKPNFAAFFIDDVSLTVYKITAFVDTSAKVIF
jgi:hypothetical protein